MTTIFPYRFSLPWNADGVTSMTIEFCPLSYTEEEFCDEVKDKRKRYFYPRITSHSGPHPRTMKKANKALGFWMLWRKKFDSTIRKFEHVIKRKNALG